LKRRLFEPSFLKARFSDDRQVTDALQTKQVPNATVRSGRWAVLWEVALCDCSTQLPAAGTRENPTAATGTEPPVKAIDPMVSHVRFWIMAKTPEPAPCAVIGARLFID
jgi:hypothetical protein